MIEEFGTSCRGRIKPPEKQLRLLEARRLMLDENLDAASAASRVGYQDASSIASTKATSESPPCAMYNACGKKCRIMLPDEPDEDRSWRLDESW